MIFYLETKDDFQSMKDNFSHNEISDIDLIMIGTLKNEGIIQIEKEKVFRLTPKLTESSLLMVGRCSQ